MAVRSGKISVFCTILALALLVGCGGGGGGGKTGADDKTSSTSTSSASSVVKAPAGLKNPALLITPAYTSLIYGTSVHAIPQDNRLYKANSLSYKIGDINTNINSFVYLDFSSFLLINGGNVIKTQNQINSIHLSGLAYLDNDQIIYLDSKTLTKKVASAPLGLASNNIFCGFYDTIFNSQEDSRHIVYATHSSCSGATAADIRFYLVSAKNGSSSVPKLIPQPIATLKDGWLVWKRNESDPQYIDILRCNYDCSSMVVAGKILSSGMPFAIERANETHLRDDEQIVFAVGSPANSPSSSIYMFDDKKNTLYPVLNYYDNAEVANGIYSRKSAIPELVPDEYTIDIRNNNLVAQDEQYFYIVLIGRNGFNGNKLLMLGKQDPTKYKIVNWTGGAKIDAIQVTKNKLFIKSGGGSLTHYLSCVDKNTATVSFSKDVYYFGYRVMDPLRLEFAGYDWDNDKVAISGAIGNDSIPVTSVIDSTAYEVRSKNYSSYMNFLLPSETAANYLVQPTLLQLSIGSAYLKLDLKTQQLISPYKNVNVGSFMLETIYDQVYPMITTGNSSGFAVISNGKTRMFSFDATQTDSVQCFHGC